jgi:hypothetical protein
MKDEGCSEMLFVCCVIEFLISRFIFLNQSWMFVILSIDANPTHDATVVLIARMEGWTFIDREDLQQLYWCR